MRFCCRKVPSPLFWYSMSLLNAIREEVVKRQLLLEFVFADQVEKMLERSISGILSFEFLDNSLGKLSEIVPMVCINSFPTISRDIHSVSSNVAQGIAQAVSLLHSYGHRKIGLFLSGDQTRHTREVKTAFMEQCEYYNMEHEIGPGLEKLQKQYYRYGSVRELVESGVTAIIANGESESTEVLAGIQLCGKVVPRDISPDLLGSSLLQQISESAVDHDFAGLSPAGRHGVYSARTDSAQRESAFFDPGRLSSDGTELCHGSAAGAVTPAAEIQPRASGTRTALRCEGGIAPENGAAHQINLPDSMRSSEISSCPFPHQPKPESSTCPNGEFSPPL
ncbi:MAG: substrate-binding domain-containing protein [Lentisphaeria bacterium]|nr:MAG: substrate-binding domain-containing protein [Lentisphaeria bacterium]